MKVKIEIFGGQKSWGYKIDWQSEPTDAGFPAGTIRAGFGSCEEAIKGATRATVLWANRLDLDRVKVSMILPRMLEL